MVGGNGLSLSLSPSRMRPPSVLPLPLADPRADQRTHWAAAHLVLAVWLVWAVVRRFTWVRVREYNMLVLLVAFMLCCSAASRTCAASRPRMLVCVLVLELVVAQAFFFGGAHYFPQALLGGRVTADYACMVWPAEPLRLEVRVVTAGIDSPRALALRGSLDAMGLSDNTTWFVGKHADGCNWMCANMYRVLLEPLASRDTDWILVLEDDAVLHYDFMAQLACAARDTEADALFLDARTAYVHVFDGFLNSAGVAYRASTDAAELTAWGLADCDGHRNATNFAEYDQLFKEMCESGWMQCEARALVSESGAPSLLRHARETCMLPHHHHH